MILWRGGATGARRPDLVYKGPRGDKGDQGEPGLPGSITSVIQVSVGGDNGSSNNTRQILPGASLTVLVPVVQFYLSNGDFVLNAYIDLAPTLPIAQQYTCQLKVANLTGPVDSLPIIYGLQARLNLGGAVHLSTPALQRGSGGEKCE